MNVFALQDRVVGEYRDYVQSFLHIEDERVQAFVQHAMESGALWPDVILALNPAYEAGPSLPELAGQGVLSPITAAFFTRVDGSPLRLYHHQHEAIQIAKRGEPYVITTGTGSGKSLTYLVPIYDHVVRNQPERTTVRAIIVYPMNALINSQYEALASYTQRYPDSPVRFGRYTGQEPEHDRQQLLAHPPHILLTNYVMLEYMLLRPRERVLTDRATANLQFLVLDELHTYRGRQGADVAMLIRRLRERCGNRKVLCIGTSATLASRGTRADRKQAAAAVAGKLFGVTVAGEHVVDETLRRITAVRPLASPTELRKAVEAPLPQGGLTEFFQYPLAAWAEEAFGLTVEDGRPVRRSSISLSEGARRLAAETGLHQDDCGKRLRELLAWGNRLRTPDGDPVFAFRLHQFLAAGATIYATLETRASRLLTLAGQHYAPDGERVLYPLVFCRECGQDYYLVDLSAGATARLSPRLPLVGTVTDVDEEGAPGYFAVDEEGMWSQDRVQELPDHWYDYRARAPRLKPDYRPHVPQELQVGSDGIVGVQETGVRGWFQPRPFLLCLRCGAAYDRSERNEFRKLTRLSQTGRSTASTITATAAVAGMREDAAVPATARKVLSFTDNRQDASLQAGHANDFIRAALVRAALHRALGSGPSLDHSTVGRRVFQALSLDQSEYAREPVSFGPGQARNEETMQLLLEYLLYEDLQRGWRIAQPNLEQCGLLHIEYPYLDELSADAQRWQSPELLRTATPAIRARVAKTFLEHLRRELAIGVPILDPEKQDELKRRVEANLTDAWKFGPDVELYVSRRFVLPPAVPRDSSRERSLAAHSRIGRYLRSRRTWELARNLTVDEYHALLAGLVEVLRGHYIARLRSLSSEGEAIQLLAGAFQWRLGEGSPSTADLVRSRRMPNVTYVADKVVNRFFAELYRSAPERLKGTQGHEHTAQIPVEIRRDREARFRTGDLALLFCSPTMELGVDISDLNVVHLRNVPPTPANYAQRSGRAGRGGQPALVLTLCSEGSPHDRYYFKRPEHMVSGAVSPARLDLGNEELVRSHVHSVWLAATGADLGKSMGQVLDLERGELPLLADVAHRIQLSRTTISELGAILARILDSCGTDVREASWYHTEWLEQVIVEAPRRFEGAFARWRDLYRQAVTQRDAARRVMDRFAPDSRTRQEQQQAERRHDEARNQLEFLLNQGGGWDDSDYYPYRYLAAEGFIPGYSFPRLPVRALVPSGDGLHGIDRPRFLAVAEFGPRNVIYHEGRKYRINRSLLPPGGLEARLCQAKFCLACGYVHDGDHLSADVCDQCHERLDGANSRYIDSLFEMSAVRGTPVERITCDEEERMREGYHIETYYRFAMGQHGRTITERAQLCGKEGQTLLEVVHAPQATLWRVNHGWRRGDQGGFTMDPETGFWGKPRDRSPAAVDQQVVTAVHPFVRDTRNLLLLRPGHDLVEPATYERFVTSLGSAFQRGMQMLFQVEEHEIAVERLGSGRGIYLLFWEAQEGGTGVWKRLLEDASVFAQVAQAALEVCHFDPATGEDLRPEGCGRACYDCLLSYSNQKDHVGLDRQLVRKYLLDLSQARLKRATAGRSYDEQYEWLKERADPVSDLETEFLDHLYRTRRRLPDWCQYRPPAVYVEADFFYEGERGTKGVCVFCDGPVHDFTLREEADQRSRALLADLGYKVVVVRYDADLEGQVERWPDVFGRAAPAR
jgi:hypothetical protein